jgi:hypothetical protein
MRKNAVSLLLLLIPVSIQSQTQAPNAAKNDACPIDIVRVWKSTTGEYVKTDAISAEYVNRSGKDIVAIKFGALTFNALDEPSDSYTNYLDDGGLKWDSKRAAQGKEQKPTMGTWNLWSDTVRNIDFYPLKIKFEDGTFWKDDGSYGCNAGVPALKIAKHGGLAAQAATIADLDHKSKKGKSTADDDK